MKPPVPAVAFVFAIGLLVSSRGTGQTACNAAAFGPVTLDPITISGPWTVGTNCVLNFGSRHVILDSTASLVINHATLLSGQFTMQAGASISSPPNATGSLAITVLGGTGANGDVTIAGAIDLSSNVMGGAVSITAGGGLSLNGAGAHIDAHGNATGAQGGTIILTASGSLTIGQGSTMSAAGVGANGGSISAQSLSSLTMAGNLTALGQPVGGQVVLDAATTLTSTGSVDVNGIFDGTAPNPGVTGGSITLMAGQLMSISGSVEATVVPSASAFGMYDSVAGAISLWSAGNIDLSANVNIKSLHRFGYAGSFVAVCGGDYRQLGGAILANTYCAWFACHAGGGDISITSSGGAIIQGLNDVSGAPDSCDDEGPHGTISVVAQGAINVSGTLDAHGRNRTYPAVTGIYLTSQENNIAISGILDGTSASYGPAAVVSLSAARDLYVTGNVIANVGGFCGFGPDAGLITLNALRDVVVDGTVQATGGGYGGTIAITGCKVMIGAAAVVTADFTSFYGPMVPGGTITIVSGDILDIDGLVTTVDPLTPTAGTITLRTRLPAPYSPIVGGATITPTPTIIHDNTLLPCLALQAASLTGPTPLTPGRTFAVNLDSVPSRPVLVAAALSLQHVSLNGFGWTQVNPFGPVALLADFGILGPPIPGSVTDANGHWGFAFQTPNDPFLSGITVYLDAYVMDPSAANGKFHQPPYLAVQFL